MSEFVAVIKRRIKQTVRALQEARRKGDDYLVELRTGELETLVRTAREHGVRVPEAEPLLGGDPAAC
ncbi:hypothetical protein [Segeticoccus rhizosphaerae]|jgi:hypothetical protein|uniref:hypothetical protein n=1 Tax=Segeticoccus rhizosphaerae TaxID=1104777 RepID=UPI0010C096C9|nr:MULTISPECIES: hypothetical protein [Intrasporangiaceae]